MSSKLSRLLLVLLTLPILASGFPHSHAVINHARFEVQDGDVSGKASPICTACLLAHHRVATPLDQPDPDVIQTPTLFVAEPQLPWQSAPARSLPATRAPPRSI